jgi:hypothetical protein
MNKDVCLKKMAEPFVPVQAIIVYKSAQDFYLEGHTINNTSRKGFHFEEGHPLEEDTLMKIFAGLTTKKNQTFTKVEMLPKGILYNCQVPGNFNIIWYLMKPKRKLIFSKTLKLKDTEVTLPNLSFNGMENISMFIVSLAINHPTLPLSYTGHLSRILPMEGYVLVMLR